MTARKKRRRLLVVAGVLVALVGVGLIPYPLYVTEECVVVPIERADVRAQISGIIAEVLVREGQYVEAGAALVRLDDRDLAYQRARAQALVDAASANLAKVKRGNRPEEIRREQALVDAKAQDVKFAEVEAERHRKLFERGVISEAMNDEARRDLAVKRASLHEAQAALRLVQVGSRDEEVVIAEAELRRTEAELAFVKRQSEDLVIRSPIAGHVLTPKVHERVHARVDTGELVCEVGNYTSVRVEILVPERDADVLQLGQPVAVKVRSDPVNAFFGKVTHIAPAVEVVDQRRILRVETVVDNPAGLLRPRMTGFAEIDTGKRPLAVRLFRRAIRWLRVRFLM